MFQTTRGMRDLLPEKKRKQDFVIDVIRKVARANAFQSYDIPAIESMELFSAKGAGDAIKKEIYVFKDKSNREVALRFEQTTGLCRMISNNPQLPKPFKAFSVNKVWRYDRPQKNRYREFTQADFDVFGNTGREGEFECLNVASKVLNSLGLKTKVRINNRKVLRATILAGRTPENKVLEAYRIVDKLDKIGWEGVKKELRENGLPDKKLVKLIQDNKITKEIKELSEGGAEELEKLLKICKKRGVKAEQDLSLARGLDYYTGNTFEMTTDNVSCGGGGRYDNLVKALGGKDTPAVGFAFGVDRVVNLMEERNLFKELPGVEYFVASVNDEVREEAVKIALKMRKKASVDYDLIGRNFRKQMNYANAIGAKKVVIVGPKELKKGVVKIKDLRTGKEEEEKL